MNHSPMMPDWRGLASVAKPRRNRRGSEGQAKTESEGALRRRRRRDRAGDRHEIRWRRRRCVRLVETRRIRQVERLGPELQIEPFTQLKLPEQPEVRVEQPRTTEGVQAHIAEAGLADRREGRRIVERGAKSHAAQLLNIALNLVRHLLVLRSVQ